MQEQRERLIRQVTRVVEIDYWLYLPREYARDERRWPLVLFLHGAGERGDMDKARRHGPAKLIAAGEELPFILVVPSCPADRWWDPDQIEVLLQEICATHRVDEDRVYGTGLSMGGFGTWATAITYPNRFAAIAPICGGGSPYLASRIKHLPVWTFHGAKDMVVPLHESQRMIDALQALGGDARITIYPQAEHDTWTAAYDDPELWKWMLGKRRNVKCQM
jgi:predicted peptidase